jgi:hypothetical protein
VAASRRFDAVTRWYSEAVAVTVTDNKMTISTHTHADAFPD